MYLTFRLLLATLIFFSTTASAQSSIKIQGKKLNAINKQNRKQGNWMFFNDDKSKALSCTYASDTIISPIVYYINNDTAFIRFPIKDNAESFICFHNKQAFHGSFKHDSDDSISVHTEGSTDTALLAKINSFKNYKLNPLFDFGRQNIVEFVKVQGEMAGISFDKTVTARFTITQAGKVKDINLTATTISADLEREIYLIYTNMPRWQPMFKGNRTVDCAYVHVDHSKSIIDPKKVK